MNWEVSKKDNPQDNNHIQIEVRKIILAATRKVLRTRIIIIIALIKRVFINNKKH